MQVFLPSLEFDEVEKTEYLLWVAEDGSTYWANTNTDGTHHGDAVTRSALYAMQYDDANLWDKGLPEDYRWDGLACGAFDARVARWGLAQARSPAIDAGSDDAWGYDSTSTHPKVIDMSRPDIGYKYYRRVADDDPIEDQDIHVRFRVPKMTGAEIDQFQADYEGNQTGFPDDITYTWGEDVIDHPLFDADFIPKGQHSIQVTTIDIAGGESAPAEIKLIVDPDKPPVNVE